MKRIYFFCKTLIAVFTLAGIVSWQFPGATRSVGATLVAGPTWLASVWPGGVGPDQTQSTIPTPQHFDLSTPPPTSAPAPQPTSGYVAPSTATPVPPATPPVVVGIPSVQGWSQSDCAAMFTAMSEDAQLDTASAGRYAQQGNSSQVAYYQLWASHWQAVADYMHSGPCAATPLPLSGAACSDPPQWFTTAITSHQNDFAPHPENRAWDEQWIATYSTANGLWATTEGCK